MNRCLSTSLALCALLLTNLVSSTRVHADELAVDSIMYQDPLLIIAPFEFVFADDLKPIWLKAIARPDAETRRLALDTLTLAHDRGMKGLEDTIPVVLDVLSKDQDVLVRRAAARVLVTLDQKEAAAGLAAAAKSDGILMAQIAEPALARWGDATLRDTWLDRANRPGGERAFLVLALAALEKVGETRAIEPLTKIVKDSYLDAELRTAAARALGRVSETGLVELAAEMSQTTGRPAHLGRLLAVRLLVRQSGAAAVELLDKLAVDAEPAVAAAALARLDDLDKPRALAIAKRSLGNLDAGVRTLAAMLVARPADMDSVTLLGPLLADRNPSLRKYVNSQLAQYAKNEKLHNAVIKEAVTVLASDQWRGQEQAALLLGHLDHEPAAPRLVELLKSQRGEVAISSAWALRKIQVADTLEPMLKHAGVLHEGMAGGKPVPWGGKQGSQIFQAFGEMKYRAAEPLMRKFIPKNLQLDAEMRGAALWSLGWFHVGEADSDLVGLFVSRLMDAGTTPPEVGPVRLMAAVGIGRMRATSQLETLRKFADQDGQYSDIGLACRWAIELMTGETFPTPKPRILNASGWFLQPTAN